MSYCTCGWGGGGVQSNDLYKISSKNDHGCDSLYGRFLTKISAELKDVSKFTLKTTNATT